MKLSKVALTTALLVTSSLSLAGSLSTSSMVYILAFDGEKVKSSDKLTINDTNTHQVVVNVAGSIGRDANSTFFETDPIILTFNGSGENIKISTPRILNKRQGDLFKKSPVFNITTESGQKISYKFDYLKGKGFLPNINIKSNLEQYNAGNGIAAVSAFTQQPKQSVPASKNMKTQKEKVVVKGENIAEQQLQYWFQQADKATQERFLKWAKKH